MKKQFWIIRKLFKSIRGRSISLWIQVFLLSLAVNFCLIHPLSTIIGYSIYDGNGLENVGLFTVGYQSIYWDNKADSPAYNQLVDELSLLGEVGEVNETFVEIPDISDDSLMLIIYPRIFVDRVSLPIAENPLALRKANRPDAIPLILDSRLRGRVDIGAEMPIALDGTKYLGCIAGFMYDNNEYYTVPGASSSPTLDNMLRLQRDDEPYIALTVNSGAFPDIMFDQAHSALYIFPEEGESIDTNIAKWKETVESSWVGNIYSLAEMRNEQFMTELIGGTFELYLLCAWSIALFFVGLQGFCAYILARTQRQLAVYRMLGMTRRRWVTMMAALLYIPTMLFAILGSLCIRSLGIVRIDRASDTLLIGTIICTAIFMLPAVFVEIHAWRADVADFRSKEKRA